MFSKRNNDSRGCSDMALGLYTCILPFLSNKFSGIYLRFQVSVYRTIGPLVLQYYFILDYIIIVLLFIIY